MIRNDESGITLMEILVTMVITSIAVALIFQGYNLVVRIWNEYSYRVEASDDAWRLYCTIEHAMSESNCLKKTDMNQWIFYKDQNDSIELTYINRSLFFNGSVKVIISSVDSFYFEIDETSGLCPVWKCGFVCKRKTKRVGMAWRTLCRINYQGDTIPAPFSQNYIPTDLYWEK